MRGFFLLRIIFIRSGPFLPGQTLVTRVTRADAPPQSHSGKPAGKFAKIIAFAKADNPRKAQATRQALNRFNDLALDTIGRGENE